MSKLPFAKKSLGQHFLQDKNIIHKICHDFNHESEIIIEVGPGPMILTRELAKHDKLFFVVEKDDRFIPPLIDLIGEKAVFHRDALSFDWEDFIAREKINQHKIWLVSNLPYNISVPLLINFTKVKNIKYLSLMFQKEVGQKILNYAQTKNFSNSLGLLMENYFHLKLLCKVPPGAFSPPPKVDSVVISFERKENPEVPLDEFNHLERFLRDLFQFKRKQITAGLKSYSHVLDSLSELGIEKQARAESLTSEQIFKLFKKLKEKKDLSC